MEQISQLKRRATALIQSLPESLPAPPKTNLHLGGLSSLGSSLGDSLGSAASHLGSVASKLGGGPADPTVVSTMPGTWQRIDSPRLPRAAHSIDVVTGTAYVFGGEGTTAGQPADNAMHAIVLPTGSAGADYYAIQAVAAKTTERAPPPVPIPAVITTPPEADPSASHTAEAADDSSNELKTDTTSADDSSSNASDASEETTDEAPLDKGKGKATAEATVEDVSLDNDTSTLGDVPAPRLGHATAVIGNRIFVFGGCGGPASVPLDERGRVWVFNTKSHTWSYLDPHVPDVPAPIQMEPGTGHVATNRPLYPAARSDHAAAAVDAPAPLGASHVRRASTWKEWVEGDMAEVGTPQRPLVGNIAARARDVDSDGYGTFLVHGGRLADGQRTRDLWAFDVRTRVWTELPAAPGAPRAGAAMCVSSSTNRLYRFGGFNGASEEGGQIDYLTLGLSSLDDTSAEVAQPTVTALGDWQSLFPGSATSATAPDPLASDAPLVAAEEGVAATPSVAAPDSAWPGSRSTSSLTAVSLGGGWEYLVLALGERSPSGSGEEGTGTFWGDVWAYQVPPGYMSAAGVSRAVRHILPRRWFGGGGGGGGGSSTAGGTGEGQWSRVVTSAYDEDEDKHGEGAEYGPRARGWFASSSMRELEENGIVVFGGRNGGRAALGDAWIFRLGGDKRE